VRVAAAFAAAMALVLATTGLFLYLSVGADMSDALDQDLRIRAQDLEQVVNGPAGSLAAASHGRLIERGESFAQLLDTRATVLDGTSPLGRVPLLTAFEATRATSGPVFLSRRSVPGLDEPSRLLALPVTHRGQSDVLVVGATRENRAEALRSLRTELLLVGPDCARSRRCAAAPRRYRETSLVSDFRCSRPATSSSGSARP
jgi:hypothetical protein